MRYPDESARPVGADDPEPLADEGADAEEQAVESDLDAILKEAETKRDEYLELAQRTQADFENYRKRMAAEVQAAVARGKGEGALGLIDAVDNLERALAAAGVDPDGDGEAEGTEGLAQGVLMVLRGMREALGRNGIEPVDPRGEKFDPTLHEALSTMAVEGVAPGQVVEVMQKGYRLSEQLIRPARVVVSE